MFCSRDTANEQMDKIMTSNLLTNFHITAQPFRVMTSNMDCKTLQHWGLIFA